MTQLITVDGNSCALPLEVFSAEQPWAQLLFLPVLGVQAKLYRNLTETLAAQGMLRQYRIDQRCPLLSRVRHLSTIPARELTQLIQHWSKSFQRLVVLRVSPLQCSHIIFRAIEL